MIKLSVIIPVYNEEKTIGIILDKIKKVNLRNVHKEIIIVDDSSKDKTKEFLGKISNKRIKVIYHKKNMGKGSAIRTALRHSTGNIILIQDADLEYDPKDHPKLIKPILKGKTKVVYGSRVLGRKHLKYSKFVYYLGGLSLTILTNLLYHTNISDEPCGYKVFHSSVIKNIDLKCTKFEFCPEITAKIAKRGIKIYDIPVFYNPRSRKEGKKIKFRDWLEAVYTLFRYRFFN